MDLAAERAFPTPLVNATLFPMLMLSLMRQRHTPITAKIINTEYDYVIVGAGSAGSVVAARLSEMPCVSVLLLEAGPPPPVFSEIPATSRLLWFTDIDWQYKTVPQKYTGNQLKNRQVIWPGGKTLGGSSVLNAMLYVRGNRKDYDEWAEDGAEGWSYKDVLPYFLKMEDNRDPEYVTNGYHGVGGPQTVHRARYQAEYKDPIFKAAKAMGYKVVDPNGARQTGFYDLQGFLRSGQRCSTAKAYLVPAENRTNLDILPKARVRKVVIKNRRATGVEFDYEGQTYVVKARREVIMSAGAINSPQLLMLSGIGPRKELERHKIPIVADLPVGQNLQDHCSSFGLFELSPAIQPVLLKSINPVNIAQYIQNRTGPLSAPEFCSAMAFLKDNVKNPKKDSPNFQLYFIEAASELGLQAGVTPELYARVLAPYEGKPWYFCLSHMLKPRSRGTVTLNSADPYDMPLIDPNYFDDPRDLDDVVEGLKVCNRIGTSPQMRKVGSEPFRAAIPGCEKFLGDEDAYLRCEVQSVVVTMSHQVGTARMGNPDDPRTVVDTHLRVKHVKGLRVIDASVMPTIPSGNTNAPTMMIAEKAADIIKSTIECDVHYYDEGDWKEPNYHATHFDEDYMASDAVSHEEWKTPVNGHLVDIVPPKSMNVHNRDKKKIVLKVTPWNKEIPNVTPWNQEIMFLTPPVDLLANIRSLGDIVPRLQQVRTFTGLPISATAASDLPSTNNGLNTQSQQTTQSLTPSANRGIGTQLQQMNQPSVPTLNNGLSVPSQQINQPVVQTLNSMLGTQLQQANQLLQPSSNNVLGVQSRQMNQPVPPSLNNGLVAQLQQANQPLLSSLNNGASTQSQERNQPALLSLNNGLGAQSQQGNQRLLSSSNNGANTQSQESNPPARLLINNGLGVQSQQSNKPLLASLNNGDSTQPQQINQAVGKQTLSLPVINGLGAQSQQTNQPLLPSLNTGENRQEINQPLLQSANNRQSQEANQLLQQSASPDRLSSQVSGMSPNLRQQQSNPNLSPESKLNNPATENPVSAPQQKESSSSFQSQIPVTREVTQADTVTTNAEQLQGSQNSEIDQQSILRMLNNQEINRITQLSQIISILSQKTAATSSANLPEQQSAPARSGKVESTLFHVPQRRRQLFLRRRLPDSRSGTLPKQSESVVRPTNKKNVLLVLRKNAGEDLKSKESFGVHAETLIQPTLDSKQQSKFSSSCDKDFCDNLLKFMQCQDGKSCRKRSVFAGFMRSVLCST